MPNAEANRHFLDEFHLLQIFLHCSTINLNRTEEGLPSSHNKGISMEPWHQFQACEEPFDSKRQGSMITNKNILIWKSSFQRRTRAIFFTLQAHARKNASCHPFQGSRYTLTDVMQNYCSTYYFSSSA